MSHDGRHETYEEVPTDVGLTTLNKFQFFPPFLNHWCIAEIVGTTCKFGEIYFYSNIHAYFVLNIIIVQYIY